MSDAAPVIEVSAYRQVFRVGFWRKKVVAVDGVSYVVPRGSIFGLLGPNGAGKTTTIKALMGFVRPTAGTLRLMGCDVGRPQARRSVGYLPESPYFHEHLTARELLRFYGALVGLSRKQLRDQVDALVDKVGLAHAADRPLRKYSKGMLQRIGLAQALIGDPELLILDEPMSGLDPIGRKFVADLIAELHGQGKTIVFSSHILSDVERLCTQVVMMHRGKMVAQGSLDVLLTGDDGRVETLESLFVRKASEFATQGVDAAR